MSSQNCRTSAQRRYRRPLGRRGAVALEFAILAIPFFAWLLFIFELSYDLFTQEALDSALRVAVRQIQTGGADNVSPTSNLGAGQVFVQQYLCPAAHGLLECSNSQMSISVQVIPPSESQDFAAYPTAIPIHDGTVTPFDDTLAGSAYCNAQPKTLVLVQALYLGPSFIGGLLPGLLSAKTPTGNIVHPTLSTAGFVVEPFSANSANPSSPNPPPICEASPPA